MDAAWYQVRNAAEVPSPALLVYPERIERNLAAMIRIAGDPGRLRPHIKTHKLPELVRRQVALGITRVKCATIAEAEMAALAGAEDVLLACQPVGPNAERLVELAVRHPGTRVSAVLDNVASARALSDAAVQASTRVGAWMDLDVGQHRTGIAPDASAEALYRTLAGLPGLELRGLHAYDGHLHDADPAARKATCDAAFAPVEALRARLESAGLPVPAVVAGGTPTFPMHAQREGVELSPGTCVLWDAGYAKKLPDLVFEPAAVLLTRVVSKPTPQRLCLDLGHKAVASEMPQPRVVFLNLPGATAVAHNEEHLVVEGVDAASFAVGDCVYALPWHVCPTVALHQEVWVVQDGQASARWTVTARARRIDI